METTYYVYFGSRTVTISAGSYAIYPVGDEDNLSGEHAEIVFSSGETEVARFNFNNVTGIHAPALQ